MKIEAAMKSKKKEGISYLPNTFSGISPDEKRAGKSVSGLY